MARYYFKISYWTYDEFYETIKNVRTAESVSGIIYSNIHVDNDIIAGIRESTNSKFEIPLKKLYAAYSGLTEFNTSSLKPYLDRVQSPALAILLACNAIEKYDEGQPAASATQKGVISQSDSGRSESRSWIKKFLIAFLIAGALIVIGTLFEEDTVSNGRLTEAAHDKAITAIKSQLSNPTSYVGGSWEDAVWDSNSNTKRYVLKHNFSQKNSWGERVRSVAFIYFDVEGNPTDIEIIQ